MFFGWFNKKQKEDPDTGVLWASDRGYEITQAIEFKGGYIFPLGSRGVLLVGTPRNDDPDIRTDATPFSAYKRIFAEQPDSRLIVCPLEISLLSLDALFCRALASKTIPL